MQIESSAVYHIRPDIFIKGAQDRLHIQYAGQNYILRLQRELIDSLYACIGRMDGLLTLDSILETLPEAHRAPAARFVGFLLDKRAAFRIPDPADEAALHPVADTLHYLRLYGDDCAATYRRFAGQRILVVAAGYALASAVKTLARLGIRDLCVLDAGAGRDAGWRDAELRQCFDELRRWPDAALTLLSGAQAAQRSFDHVLHIVEHDSEAHRQALQASGDAEQLVAAYAGRHLCLLHREDYLAQRWPQRAACHLPERLIAGATATLFFFDHLCGIRRLRAGRYHHYDLRGESTLRFAGLEKLIPLSDIIPGQERSAPWSDVPLDKLLAQPLFPLQNLVEHTDPASYLKLYTVDLETAAGNGTLAAAGRDRRQCEDGLLAQLVIRHGLWFARSGEQEIEALRRHRADQLRGERVVDALAPQALREARRVPVELSAPEQYIVFCINARFGSRVAWSVLPTGDAELPHCTLLTAGDAVISMPHAGDLCPATRQAALLALYAGLWQQARGGAPARHTVVADATPAVRAAAALP